MAPSGMSETVTYSAPMTASQGHPNVIADELFRDGLALTGSL
jgi:hypothetical protein